MKIISLDQNKWIQLAQARESPRKCDKIYNVLEFLLQEVCEGRVIVPLLNTNIYETIKINHEQRRANLSALQAELSRGFVIVGHYLQRQIEIRNVLRSIFVPDAPHEKSDWFLSKRFWESVTPIEMIGSNIEFSALVLAAVDKNPSGALLSYLNDLDEDTRRSSVRVFTNGISEFLAKIEKRRQQLSGVSLSIRRKVLSALIFMDNQDYYWAEINSLNISTETFKASSDATKRCLIHDVPCLHIERELALKLETEPTKLKENDVRDLKFFCSALPYSDVIVAEKAFINRARQAKLGEKYNTELITDICKLNR